VDCRDCKRRADDLVQAKLDVALEVAALGDVGENPFGILFDAIEAMRRGDII